VAAFGKKIEKALSDFGTCHGESFGSGVKFNCSCHPRNFQAPSSTGQETDPIADWLDVSEDRLQKRKEWLWLPAERPESGISPRPAIGCRTQIAYALRAMNSQESCKRVLRCDMICT
jgi:hypothetical protein